MLKIAYVATEAKGFVEEDHSRLSYDQIFSNLYGYCFMFDPFILACAQSIPRFGKYSEMGGLEGYDLVLVPHKLSEEQYGKEVLKAFTGDLIRFGNNSGKLLLVQPGRKIYRSLDSLKGVILEGELISNHEYLKMHGLDFKERIYPGKLAYQLIHGVIETEEVKGTVGERIAVLVRDNVAVFTIDPFMAYFKTRNFDISETSDDFSRFLTKTVHELSGIEYTTGIESQMCALSDLRRDFHAFGFAYVMIKELFRLRDIKEDAGLAEAESAVLRSAEDVARGNVKDAAGELKSAFETLHELRLKAAPIDIYLLDSLHGGTLWEDHGFAEYDWPQGAAKLLEIYIKLAEEKNYRFNYEAEAHTLENFNRRFPLTCRKLASLWHTGKIEIVNGTYSQPYSYLCSPESNIRQFEHGIDKIREIFGVVGWHFNAMPVTYAAQEHGLNPQMPQILANFGYKYAVHLIQNAGDVPPVKEDKIFWRGSDDSMIEALPAHSEKSYKKGEALYIHLPRLIVDTMKDGHKYAALVNMQDQNICNFREETIRANFYAPVFGRFCTFKEFFERTERPKAVRRFRMDDYEFKTILDSYESIRGNENTCSIEALSLEHLLMAAEMICGIFSCTARKEHKLWKYWEPHWKILNMLQNHDVVIVHRGKTGGYGQANIYQYLGPVEDITVGELARRDLKFAVDDARREIGRCLRGLRPPGHKHTKKHSVIFNPLSVERDGVPPCGYKMVTDEKAENRVDITDRGLSNEFLKITIDERTGALNQIVLINGKKELLKGFGNELAYADDSGMVCEDIKVNEGAKQIECSGSIVYKGRKLCDYSTGISLKGRTISFKTRLGPGGKLNGNPWTHSVRARFATALNKAKATRCWLNIWEETKLERFNSLYFTRLESDGHTFDLYNNGNQFYVRRGNVLENLLKFAHEEGEEFEYAVGIDEPNGLIASLCWQVPLFEGQVKAGSKSRGEEKFSLVSADDPDVLISSCRYLGEHKFHFRLIETMGTRKDIRLTFAYPVKMSVRQDYLYNTQEQLASSSNTVSLGIKPWEIVQMFVSFDMTKAG